MGNNPAPLVKLSRKDERRLKKDREPGWGEVPGFFTDVDCAMQQNFYVAMRQDFPVMAGLDITKW